ncbi:Lrp/AsnC family transcriptional regulator [Hansschlegelia plantiphila]|nr:Lrp/AsnC family transcriptional regulator [Hansschlegelia plantiphila]
MLKARDRTSPSLTEEGAAHSSWAGNNLLRHWPLSDVDRRIIAHLQEDGRRPFVTIARDIGVTEKTVRSRVRQLLTSNIIQIVALTTPSALGYKAGALAALTTDPSVAASKIAAALTQIDDVDYVVITTGRYGIFAEIISRNMKTLQETVETQIGKIAGVRSVEVFPYFSLFYQQARFFMRGESANGVSGVRDDELDQVDKSIASELSYDGRVALKVIADKLDISETQVRTRIQNMTTAGTMSILAIVNPMNLQNRSIAWVAIKSKGGEPLRDLADKIAQISYVSYVVICAGRFDIFAEFVCPSNDELLDALDQKVRQIPSVGDVEAFFYLDLHYKRLVPVRGEGRPTVSSAANDAADELQDNHADLDGQA